MNRIILNLRMFEYTRRPKDLEDLIYMFLTFRNRSLLVVSNLVTSRRC